MFIMLDKTKREVVTVKNFAKKYPNCSCILLQPEGENENLKGELYCIADSTSRKDLLNELQILDKKGKSFALYDGI